MEQRTHKTATVDKNTSGFPPNICSYKTDSLKKQKDVNSGESSAILFQIKTTNEAKQVESQRISNVNRKPARAKVDQKQNRVVQ